MAERDDEFEFDFFEEPSTQETAVGARAVRRAPGPPKPPARPPSGLTPLLRLIGLIAFAIVAVLVLVFVIQGCRDEGQADEYQTYMQNVSQVARESDTIGRELNRVLTQPGIGEEELERRLNGLAQQQQQLVATARGFDPPGRLAEQQQALIEALEFRVNGLRGIQAAFRSTANSDDADEAGRLISAEAQRLVASDVVWDDRFRRPAREELRAAGIVGVQVPNSDFLVTPDLATTATLKPIWQRLHGAQTDGVPTGLHGNHIVSTVILPAEEALSQDTETTIEASTDLAFQVTIENSGDATEVQVEVTLTIQRSQEQGGPIVLRRTIGVVNPGEQQSVTFRDVGQPPFATPTTIKVDVKPVPGEENTGNNTAEYPVVFSFA